jgi:hypothetical protein
MASALGLPLPLSEPAVSNIAALHGDQCGQTQLRRLNYVSSTSFVLLPDNKRREGSGQTRK